MLKDIGNRKRFHPRDLLSLTPLNDNQEKYLAALYSDIPIVLGLGPAGTGKSALCIHSALYQVFDESTPYDKVHIIRNIVESGERIGFLPGAIEEKLAPYEAPYRALAQEFLNFFDPYCHLKDLDYLSFSPPNFIRGVTLEGIIIIEEAQNIDYGTLRDIISRAGKHTKIVVNGDLKQNDLFKLGKRSGLGRLQEVLTLMPYESVATIDFQLDDIVRSGVTKDFLIADYDYHKE